MVLWNELTSGIDLAQAIQGPPMLLRRGLLHPLEAGRDVRLFEGTLHQGKPVMPLRLGVADCGLTL